MPNFSSENVCLVKYDKNVTILLSHSVKTAVRNDRRSLCDVFFLYMDFFKKNTGSLTNKPWDQFISGRLPETVFRSGGKEKGLRLMRTDS